MPENQPTNVYGETFKLEPTVEDTDDVRRVPDRRRSPRRASQREASEIAFERRKGDRRRKAGMAGLIDAIFGKRARPEENALALAESIKTGIAPKVWSHLRGIGFTAQELASVIGVSEKTLSRKQGSRERLDIVEGDRTVRLAQLTVDAEQAFGDLDKALRWLRKPNRTLAGEKPIDLIATEPGAALVRKALGIVEYGGVA